MKKHLFAALLLLLAAAPALAKPVTGAAAPAFTATDSNGKTLSLQDFKGKTVVLEWSNHECPFVKKHYESGNMQALQKQAAADGIVWLTVLSSAPGQQGHVDGAAANALTQERGAAPFAVALDPSGTLGRLYEAKTTPHMFVIGPDGALVYKGAIDSIPSADKADIAKAENHVSAALAALKAGTKPATAETRSYGCGVKYAE